MLAKFGKNVTPTVSRARYSSKGFQGVNAVTDTGTKSLDFCCYGYNIKIIDGVLETGVGIDSASYEVGGNTVSIGTLATRAQQVYKMHWFPHKDSDGANADELLTYGSGQTLYAHPLLSQGTHTQISLTHGTVPEIEFVNYYRNGKNRAYAYLGSGGLIEYDGTTSVTYQDVPGLYSVCMLGDRVFGVDYEDRNTIWYSSALKPEEFKDASDSGKFSLMDEGGAIRKLVAYDNALYVFRDFMINKVTIYGGPENYAVKKVYSSGDRIYGDTVATNGHMLTFIAGDKLYMLDASGLTIGYEGVTALANNFQNAVGALSGEKYFLSVKLKTRGELIGDEATAQYGMSRNGIIIINLYSKAVTVFRGADVKQLLPIYSPDLKIILLAFGNQERSTTYGALTNDGCFYGSVLPKLWLSPTMTLGDLTRVKRVRRMHVRSAGDISVTLRMGGVDAKRYVYGNARTQDVIFNESVGDDLSVKIESNAATLYVEPFELTLDLYRRYV